MTSFDYRLNPLYPIKECSSCGALYTTDYCCSVGILGDKIIYDLDKTPYLSQRSPQNCPKCGNPVYGHYCQGCALLREKFKEDLFASCVENGILQNSYGPSNENSNVSNALREPFVVNLDPVSRHSSTSQEMSIQKIEDLKQQYFDEMKRLINLEYRDKIKIDELNENFNSMSIEINKKEKLLQLEQLSNLSTYPSKSFNSFCYDDDDDDEEYTIAVTPKSDEFIKSSVENLVPIPSESEGESECDVPTREEFTTLSNILFDSEYEFDSSDDQSCSDEDVPEKIFSNPLFEEEIIPMKIYQHHFNAESDLIESLRTYDSSLIISSKIDSLLDEFAGELILLKSIPLGIDETDCDPQEEIHLIERLLYNNSSPRPLKEFVSKNSDTEIESFSPSPIPVEDSDSLIEEIDLSFTLDYPMPPSIEDDNYDSERDILILKDFLSNDTISLPEIESFHFDIPSFSRPPAKPPDGNTRILNVKMMGDISEQKVPMPKLMITLVPNQEKSPDLLSHQGLKARKPDT
nr:hypothetical protein [Tanacetum cinerariifolium]GFA27006.1 hypothetical protein [Tanacetum cinerariifolium]